MKIQYQDGEIYFGDSFDILPTLEKKSVEISITSPPYNLNKRGGSGTGSKISENKYSNWYPDEVNEYRYLGEQRHMIYLLRNVSRSSIFYNHKVRYAWHERNLIKPKSKIFHPFDIVREFPIYQEITWVKKGITMPSSARLHNVTEKIYIIGKPQTWSNPRNYTNVWKIEQAKKTKHPCPYPEEIVRRCIELTTNERDIILDPYMGSGTTCLVAKSMNRRFIGIEKNRQFFEFAKSQLNKSYQQLKLF